MKKEFCTLSRQYHGLELVDWPVEKLSADIFVMLQNWDQPTLLGHCLRDAYELLQMETGLEGNIFSYNFEHLGHLATHSWMKRPTSRLFVMMTVPSSICFTNGDGGVTDFSVQIASASSNASIAYRASPPWTTAQYSLKTSLLMKASTVEYGLMRSPQKRTIASGMMPFA
jgi:hypothetical protein